MAMISPRDFAAPFEEVQQNNTDDPSEFLLDVNVDTLQSYMINPPHHGPLSGFDFTFHLYPESSDMYSGLFEPSHRSSQGEYTYADEMGAWPQRLLHVPSMTSYEWTPGNVYGTHVEPGYNAISYTWGRYDLEYMLKKRGKKRFRSIKPIAIEGIPWAEVVPRIHPDHFSATEFQHIINQTQNLSASSDVEFVWLDVACIDQRDGPQKAMEIGRQASIFKGASTVFVWLTRLQALKIGRILECLSTCAAREELKEDNLAESIRSQAQYLGPVRYTKFALETASELCDCPAPVQSIDEQIGWLSQVRTSLDQLFMDPWFTSLWTLQEAFLCPHAYLLPREATTPVHTLADLCRWCETIHKACMNTRMFEKISQGLPTAEKLILREKYMFEVELMITDRSLTALASRNPMALYGAASYRKTRNELDRVYGIEQVFGLRLGTSAPGSSNQGIHPLILENELGTKILETYPVLGQMHVFTEPIEWGRGWKISGSSRIPDLGLGTNLASLQFTPTYRLATERAGHMRWGFFDGRICSFERMRKAWVTVSSSPQWVHNHQSISPQHIALDVFLNHKKPEYRHIPSDKLGPEGWESPYPAVWGYSRDIPRGKEQHELASWMSQRLDELFKGKRIVVLYLGCFEDEPERGMLQPTSLRPQYKVGLILIESEYNDVSYWRRLGFCIWECADPSDTSDPAEAAARTLLAVIEEHELWQREAGRFG